MAKGGQINPSVQQLTDERAAEVVRHAARGACLLDAVDQDVRDLLAGHARELVAVLAGQPSPSPTSSG
jgi:uncharacterized membrane-anchored protein YhcB (DUF1043 family)